MKNNKISLVHEIWDIHNNNYAYQQVKGNPQFTQQLMMNLFCPGVSYFYTVDFSSRQFSFVSPTVLDVLGYDKEEFNFDKMLSLIHPDELDYVRCSEMKIIDFLFNKIETDKITKYKFTYSLRLKHKNGSYRKIMHQAIAISQDKFGRMSEVLGIQTDVGHILPFNNYRLSIIGLDGEPSYLDINPFEEDNESYLDKSKNYFTPRELEIIRLFADGYTAQKVADFLNISVGTVRTHRQNALQKSKCENMTNLVAKCIREGLV